MEEEVATILGANGGGAITVKVRAFAMLRDIIPAECNAEISRGSTVGDLLAYLSARYPGLGDALFTPTGEIRAYVNILKNGRNVHFSGGLEAPLDDGDTVALFPPAAGG
ncbi:MAG: MoaD/ThiS family protein [Methanoculleus sp.]|uniref:ubiquitin-like small modifier protein 1 n=1 Tax=Methanoculleus sp. TaxID=90427 RepID=UPI00261AA149|nr:ubiquitin-like small modifier protein 1 [Methanoculleus sp.]MDD3216276.1 MoaD/ThiS family protein [Methanoculleus sp.]MDD4314813.1 MoaD/ThiS family protein [Methanoculleus sp.]MDD4469637.1 MoaD/ThiS family protein [Methanoculleus sp.]